MLCAAPQRPDRAAPGARRSRYARRRRERRARSRSVGAALVARRERRAGAGSRCRAAWPRGWGPRSPRSHRPPSSRASRFRPSSPRPGAGRPGAAELADQTASLLGRMTGEPPEGEVFPRPLAFDCLPADRRARSRRRIERRSSSCASCCGGCWPRPRCPLELTRVRVPTLSGSLAGVHVDPVPRARSPRGPPSSGASNRGCES